MAQGRVAATATWFPQNPQQGSGYLSVPSPYTTTHPSPRHSPTPAARYPSPSPYQQKPAVSPQPPPPQPQAISYGQYAVNYYHHHNMQREAYFRRSAAAAAAGQSSHYPAGFDWRMHYPYGHPPPGLQQVPPGYPHGYPGIPPGHPAYYQDARGPPPPGWPGYPHGMPPHMAPRPMPPNVEQPPQQQQPQQAQQQQQDVQASPSTQPPPTPSQSQTGPGTPAHVSQATTPAPPATPGQPGTPASVSGANLQVDQPGSRAPSAGPPPPATPDSTSRLSAGGDDRPPKEHGSLEIVKKANMPPNNGAPSPYYPGYPPPPQRGGPPIRPPYPGYPPQYAMGPQGQYMQQPQYWRGPPGPGYNGPPQPAGPQQPPPSAASPAQRYMPRTPGQGAPSPNPQQRPPTAPQPYPAPPSQQCTPRPAAPPAPAIVPAPARFSEQPPAPVQQQQQPLPFSQPHTFPPGCVEALPMSTRKRKRPVPKELIGSNPRRILMALRSGIELESIWALNMMSVHLAEENNSLRPNDWLPMLPPLIDHFAAALSLLWPDIFPLAEPTQLECKDVEVPSDKVLSKTLLSAKHSTPVTKELVGKKDKKSENYTNVTRTGRQVKFEDADMPEELKRSLCDELPARVVEDFYCELTYGDDRYPLGPLAARLAATMRRNVEAAAACKKNLFKRVCVSASEPEEPELKKSVKEEEPEDVKMECPLFYRDATPQEKLSGPIDFEAEVPKRSAIAEPEEALTNVANRALCISNALRSLSFHPAMEKHLAQCGPLLLLLSRFLRLEARQQPFVRLPRLSAVDNDGDEQTDLKRPLTMSDTDDELYVLRVETASQIREDVLTMLCHISGSLHLYDIPNTIAYNIMDGLLHWATSPLPCATDPRGEGNVSLRNYALEVLCKLCVTESNVDLLCATGPWPRLERLVIILSQLVNMNEETHVREFGIVVLNATVGVSAELCWVAAHQSPAIEHLISFIETADSNMHQVMQQHGMAALRGDPEMMGTSVGMLRRAASLLRQLSRAHNTSRLFAKHQNRLLQFTMSQLMDSRVAGMIADTLFAVQTSISDPDDNAKPLDFDGDDEGAYDVKKSIPDVDDYGGNEDSMDGERHINGDKEMSDNSNQGEDTMDSTTIQHNGNGIRSQNGEGSGSESGDSPRQEHANDVKGQTQPLKSQQAQQGSSPRPVPNGIHPRENGGGMTAVA
ncbi:unnamed protein product, partial [Mesorhabditis spiculigera]